MEESLHAGVASLDMILSLAFTIKHQHGLFLHAKEMLYRRLAKLQNFHQATNQLDRASGKKKEAVSAFTMHACMGFLLSYRLKQLTLKLKKNTKK